MKPLGSTRNTWVSNFSRIPARHLLQSHEGTFGYYSVEKKARAAGRCKKEPPIPGGWNRILLTVNDLPGEVKRLHAEGVKFRREDIVSGPGGSQAWLVDPSGNLVELFQAKD